MKDAKVGNSARSVHHRSIVSSSSFIHRRSSFDSSTGIRGSDVLVASSLSLDVSVGSQPDSFVRRRDQTARIVRFHGYSELRTLRKAVPCYRDRRYKVRISLARRDRQCESISFPLPSAYKWRRIQLKFADSTRFDLCFFLLRPFFHCLFIACEMDGRLREECVTF